LYEDGESETRVDEQLIRLIDVDVVALVGYFGLGQEHLKSHIGSRGDRGMATREAVNRLCCREEEGSTL
jgi:hypothetical protein